MGNGSQNNTINSPHKALNRLSTVLFYLSILFFIIGFGFTDSVTGNWYQQFMPNIGSKQIQDINFLDSLTGYAIASQTSDSSYILKTTNGGDNWLITYRQGPALNRIQFLNLDTGYSGGSYLFKTTNGGFNWNTIVTPGTTQDIFVLNQDTIWYVDPNALQGGVFRTTNGGVSWTQQAAFGNQNPSRIYMFNRNTGFICRPTGQELKITTDGGFNWQTEPTSGAFTDIHFVDSLTGWKSGAPGGPGFRKTTDGGYNWFDQILPQGGNIVSPQIERFSNVIRDTIWGAGAIILTPTGLRGMVDRTTNGGNNWYFQVPDTSIHISQYHYSEFVNKLNGWEYTTGNTGIHTTTGGDTIFLTEVHQISSEIPKEFKLYQNFPNPFNPKTNIKYQISNNKFIKLVVYDIMGKEVITLANQKQNAGTYQVDFSGNNISSGIYFYSLYVDNKLMDTKKMILLK